MQLETIKIENYYSIVHGLDESGQLLPEAQHKGKKLAGQYSAIKHQLHNLTGEYHFHVYKKENEIFSINKGGRGDDGHCGTRIPNDVYNALCAKHPEWKFPKTQIIESLNPTLILDKSMRGNLRSGFVAHHTFTVTNVGIVNPKALTSSGISQLEYL